VRLSADPTGEIDELVEALESAHSPWQKVKVLAKGWQTVRKLRPDERLLVAKHVGLEGAEVFLDKLGDPYRGLPTDELLGIVRAAEAEDFERWKAIVSRLRTPEERQALLRKGIGQAKKALLAEPVELDEPETRAAETVEDVPPLPPVEELEVNRDTEGIEVAVERKEPWEGEDQTVEPDAKVEVPEEVALEPGPEPTNLSERLALTGTVLSRLQRFNALRGEMRDLEGSTLGQLLKSLPPGWARRRALSRLYEAGIPEDLQDALALLDTQERRADRLWCLSVLVDSRTLSPDEKGTLLARAESPAFRRRLESRMGR
jgi:hypothetical protein